MRHRKVAVSFYALVLWGAPRLPSNRSRPFAVWGSLIISGQAAEGVGKMNLFQPVDSTAVHKACVTASPCYPRAPTQYENTGLKYPVHL